MDDSPAAPPSPVEVELPDGTPVRLRPIRPDDKDLLVEGMRRLSPESRYRRFFSAVHELTPAQLVYLTEVDHVDHFAWVALVPEDNELVGAGVARYIRAADDPDTAEAAVAVIDEYHHRGLGTLLLQALTVAAWENGIRHFTAQVLSDNVPVRHIFRTTGGRLDFDVGTGALRGVFDLPDPAQELRGTGLYEAFRSSARGEVGFGHPSGTDGLL